MSAPQRETELALALAKQIATYNGQILEKVNPKVHSALMTLAFSIIATVDRLRLRR